LSRVCADPDQPPTPGTRCTVEAGGEEDVPDISTDATPGVQLEVPVRFLQQTMIDLTAHTPADGCEGDEDGDPGCPDGTFSHDGELARGLALDTFLPASGAEPARVTAQPGHRARRHRVPIGVDLAGRDRDMRR
jgi:hypothetical protein